ncbi:hypothetical protein [Rhizobium sp. MHM7A]|uniref:hypothetical protein n=1 Tax=Rhizobium sp. MHM7A TaxID=2583233 RepID=UPI00110721D2|nr:hypothetical protein [Rhizobium sp. MHM7A]TLX16255.1 hypothetical protein FFR93_02700 [Rhizobium sp. MHM7A]
MTEITEDRADHVLSLQLIPWKDIESLVKRLRLIQDDMDDGSNFGRVDAMSIGVAANILESLGKPSVSVLSQAAKIAAEKRSDWSQDSVPEAIVETAHLSALEAMLRTFSEIGARETFWPAPVYDAWRQCHKIGDHAYSEDEAQAKLIAENVNAYLAAGEPYMAEDDRGRPEVWKLLGEDVWFIDDVGYSDDETKANLIAAAFAWRKELSEAP